MREGRIIEREMEHGTVRFFQAPGTRRKPEGSTYTHFECERRAKAAVAAMSRWLGRAIRTRTTWTEDTASGEFFGMKTTGVIAAQMNEDEIRQLRWIADDISEYAEIVQRELDRLEGVDRKAERIRQLRNVAGRTPEEAAAYLAKAAQLEGGD